MIGRTSCLRPRALAIVLGVCALLGMLALAGAPAARAAFQRPYLSQLTGTPGGAFSGSLCGVTVNPASQDVYVADPGNDAIDIFNSAGVYQSQITGLGIPAGRFSSGYACSVAVSDTTGDVYVADSETDTVYVFNALGGYLATINGSTTPGGSLGSSYVHVAVDQSSGAVYIADITHGVVDRYNSADEYQSQLTGLSLPWGLATDSTGDVYVAEAGSVGGVREFDSAGAEIGSIAGSAAPGGSFGDLTGVAVDSAGDISVSDTGAHAIDDFDSAKTLLDQTGGTPAGTFNDLQGLAINAGGDLYVVDRGSPGVVDVFGPNVLIPDVASGEASSVSDKSATIAGTVNPDGTATTYQFEYGTSTAYGSASPMTPASVGSDASTHSLSADLTGLTPNTVYHYRIAATNKNGTNRGADRTFRTLGPPVLGAESFSQVGSTSASLSAQVDDHGTPSTYHYEYGTSAAYGTVTPETSLGAVDGEVNAAILLSSLQPATLYHFRLVAADSFGVATGADQTFTTLPAELQGLPDGRGYEMVTPPQDEDANMFRPAGGLLGQYVLESGVPASYPFQAAADGDAVAYVGNPTSGGNGSGGATGGGNQYLAARSSGGGWTQSDIQPPGYRTPVYQGFSSDLSVAFLDSCEAQLPPLQAGAPGGAQNVLYARDASDGSYHALVTSIPATIANLRAAEVPDPSRCGGAIAYAGSSADQRHTLFETSGALTASAEEGGEELNNLYDSFDGQLYLINVLPDGSSKANETFGALPLAQYTRSENNPDFSHVISADGSRIFWTDLNNGDLYVRENATESDARTVQVDASQGAGPGGGGRFWTASADGSKVLFTDSAAAGLTSDTAPGSGENLYEYEVPSGHLRDLTAADEAAVDGVLGTSEDGEYVYFTAAGELAAGSSAGQANLYLFHAGAITFIAALSPQDDEVRPTYWQGGGGGHHGDWQPGLGNRTAEVSANGEGVVFMSTKSLTGYPNENIPEVYLYNAEEGQVHCVSCSPSGEPPPLTSAETEEMPGGFLATSESNTYMSRWISQNGSRVFFDSVEPLVPQDVNGRVDVYEWERDGTGSCAQAAGCIYVLSGGTGTAGSWLLDASASGGDVFFATRTKLVREDQNEDIDVYDARIGAAQPLSSPACSGTGCQGVPLAPPVFATPASQTYAGVGNFPPAAATAAKPRSKPLSRARKLARALKLCHKQAKRRRASCEARAKKQYTSKSGTSRSAKGRNKHA